VAEDKRRSISVKVGNSLSKRINRHVRFVGRMREDDLTKSKWLEEAIVEKLRRDEKHFPDDLGRDARLSCKISQALHDAVSAKVAFFRMFREGYSKTRWIMEAVDETLAAEEPGVWKHWQEMQTDLRGPCA